MHITVQLMLQYATLGTLITGVVSLVVWARIYRRQVNAQIFIEVSSRYVNMLRSFPPEVWAARFNNAQPLPAASLELTAGVLEYFSILVFVYVLRRRRYLANDLWRVLQAEHERTVTSALFAREWQTVKGEFEMYPNFVAYVDSLQLRHERPREER